MKLSRRGKHKKQARRGKHTKRAGKHLRYKSKSKKFSGSKRYHRGNKRTYKRGKRFHRGGGVPSFDNDNIEPGSPSGVVGTITTAPRLPEKISSTDKIGNYSLDFKRTDGVLYTFSKPITGVFDVFVDNTHRDHTRGIILLRHSDTDNTKYDKKMYISKGDLFGKIITDSENRTATSIKPGPPFENIIATNPYTTSINEGTYTFPDTSTNRSNFTSIKSSDMVVVNS